MFDRSSTLGATLDSPGGRAVLDEIVPGLSASPVAAMYRDGRLGQMVTVVPALRDDEALQARFWELLAAVEDGDEARTPYSPAIEPDPAYEGDDIERASAEVAPIEPSTQWGVIDVRIDGPSHGNPFVDVELTAVFTNGEDVRRVGGFYDGDGVYRLRLLAETQGVWTFTTTSTARSLDGLAGSAEVGPPATGAHGPVRVDGMHFRHADGARYRPVGTTAYAWTHQPEEIQERTLATLASSSFTKIRMCVFPKSYLYNANEPERFPFLGSLEDGFDFERFDVDYFRHLETRITQLAQLGIEADLILFHAYDRWGFADMGPAVDDRYTRYVVRRLAAFSNVWWSMANEFDLLWAKRGEDWERLASVVVTEDPHGHLTSIHNCMTPYDQSREWITHVSIQRIDVYRTAENTDTWRETWNKPVVVDECGYEGDIDQGWGNLTAEELVRRCWEGAIRGGYLTHGETYLADDEELWWAKGGDLRGLSPERMGFLDRIIGEAPDGVLDPLPSDWDLPWGGVAGRYQVAYFGFNRPRFRNFSLPEGTCEVDVIDTWNMTVDTLPGTYTGTLRVELPGRQFMAVRVRVRDR